MHFATYTHPLENTLCCVKRKRHAVKPIVQFIFMNEPSCGVDYRLSERMNQLNVFSSYNIPFFFSLFLRSVQIPISHTEKSTTNQRKTYLNLLFVLYIFIFFRWSVKGSVLSIRIAFEYMPHTVCGNKKKFKWDYVQSVMRKYYVPV